jgi:hypothetical protein
VIRSKEDCLRAAIDLKGYAELARKLEIFTKDKLNHASM